MFYRKKYSIILICICFVTVISVYMKNSILVGSAYNIKPIEETKDKLEGLTKEEKVVIENLFLLTQEILEMEKEETQIGEEIIKIELESKNLQEQINISQINYDTQLDILEKVLVSYQKRGPVSYIDTLLSAGDLKTFVRSLNIIREFSKSTASLLDSLKVDKEKLILDIENLSKSLVLLEVKREELKEPLEKKLKLKEEQEKYLQSLGEQRELYGEYLNEMELKWDENKELFKSLVEDFGAIIKDSNIDIEDLNMVFSFFGVTGTIYEDTFNGLFADHETLSKMNFIFHEDSIQIDIPSLHLTLLGTFILEEESILKLLVKEGTFYDMPLEESSITELFAEGDININVKELVKDMVTIDFTMEEILIKDGYLEFKLTPKLF